MCWHVLSVLTGWGEGGYPALEIGDQSVVPMTKLLPALDEGGVRRADRVVGSGCLASPNTARPREILAGTHLTLPAALRRVPSLSPLKGGEGILFECPNSTP